MVLTMRTNICTTGQYLHGRHRSPLSLQHGGPGDPPERKSPSSHSTTTISVSWLATSGADKLTLSFAGPSLSMYRKMRQGVPQGGVRSPVLFNLYMATLPPPPHLISYQHPYNSRNQKQLLDKNISLYPHSDYRRNRSKNLKNQVTKIKND